MIIGSMLLIIVIVLIFIGNFLFTLAIHAKLKKRAEYQRKKTKSYQEMKAKNAEYEKWLSTREKEVQMVSEDNLCLYGYILEGKREHDWVILVHGYRGNHIELTDVAQHFLQIGRNVLMIDLRGHGKSKAHFLGMGWKDRKDVLQWISYILQKDKDASILLYGVSMGASTVMMTTGETLPSNVTVAIEDCGYTSVWEELKVELRTIFKCPPFPLLYVASGICKLRAGYSFKEASCITQLKKSKTPTLFIHGKEDTFVPFTMLEELYAAANCRKQKLIIEGAKHAKAREINPELYWKTIEAFIEKEEGSKPC